MGQAGAREVWDTLSDRMQKAGDTKDGIVLCRSVEEGLVYCCATRRIQVSKKGVRRWGTATSYAKVNNT